MDDAQTKPRNLTLPERIHLTRTLNNFGLGHVRLPGITTTRTPCHGHANCCPCPDCTTTPQPANAQPAQPWQPRPARLKDAA